MGWLDSFKKDFRQDYIKKILRNSIEVADTIRHLAEEEGVEEKEQGFTHVEWFSVLMESIYFYLHLTDRFACKYGIDEGRRKQLMTSLADATIDSAVQVVCQGLSEDAKDKIKKECKDNLDISMMHYSKCKNEFPGEGKSSKDTLFWEFGMEITRLAGRRTIEYVLTAQDIVAYSVIEGKVDIKSFIEKGK